MNPVKEGETLAAGNLPQLSLQRIQKEKKLSFGGSLLLAASSSSSSNRNDGLF